MCRLTLLVEQVMVLLLTAFGQDKKLSADIEILSKVLLPLVQLSSQQTKMTSVTLRAGNSKLMKLWVECEVSPSLCLLEGFEGLPV